MVFLDGLNIDLSSGDGKIKFLIVFQFDVFWKDIYIYSLITNFCQIMYRNR